MPLTLLTLGLIAERLAPGGTLHTVGQIDVFVAVVWLLFAVLLGLLKAVSDS